MLYLLAFLLGLLVGLVILILVLMHFHNKPQWRQSGVQVLSRAGKGSCCRADAPCSARCAELAIAQTVAGAVEAVQHGDGLRDLIRLLDYLPPERLRELIDAEAADPGTLGRISGALRAGAVGALEGGRVPGGLGRSGS